MRKEYKCCICHKPIKKNKRLVYQEFDNKKSYGTFHNRYNYDFCDKCIKMFNYWVKKHKVEKEEF